jgi:cob(I)alamin adenosyltransferase
MLQTHFSETTAEMVTALEEDIDEMLPQMKLPQAFIVPGASAGSGALDLARSMLRTGERRVVALHEDGKMPNPEVLRYLNRLSDLLFVLARFEDRALPIELTTGEA